MAGEARIDVSIAMFSGDQHCRRTTSQKGTWGKKSDRSDTSHSLHKGTWPLNGKDIAGVSVASPSPHRQLQVDMKFSGSELNSEAHLERSQRGLLFAFSPHLHPTKMPRPKSCQRCQGLKISGKRLRVDVVVQWS